MIQEGSKHGCNKAPSIDKSRKIALLQGTLPIASVQVLTSDSFNYLAVDLASRQSFDQAI